MKILHISNYYYPHIGGIEETAKNCVFSLKDNENIEQKVFCFNSEKDNSVDCIDDIAIIRVGSFIKISSQPLSFSYKKMLKTTINDFCPNLIIFHFPNPFGSHYLLKILKKYRCKLIVYYHLDIYKQKILGKFFKRQTRKLLTKADKIIATSPNYLNASPFLQKFKEKSVIIPSCINNDKLIFNETNELDAQEIRNKNKEKIILFAVGRHVPYKGLEYLIESSKLLNERFKIFIGGQGPLTDDLKKLAQNDNKITFLGKLSDKELINYYLACDIYCFPSITKNEAFGLSLAEAMSFGKPAITFTIEGSGVNFVNLNRVTGIEVENRNVQAYTNAILELVNNINLRNEYGQNAKKRAEELFSFSYFAKKFNELIETMKV